MGDTKVTTSAFSLALLSDEVVDIRGFKQKLLNACEPEAGSVPSILDDMGQARSRAVSLAQA